MSELGVLISLLVAPSEIPHKGLWVRLSIQGQILWYFVSPIILLYCFPSQNLLNLKFLNYKIPYFFYLLRKQINNHANYKLPLFQLWFGLGLDLPWALRKRKSMPPISQLEGFSWAARPNKGIYVISSFTCTIKALLSLV